MKHVKAMNEHRKVDKSYVKDYIVIDPQYGDIPDDIHDLIMGKGRNQNSYWKFYPGDGYFTPVSDHKDPSQAIYYKEEDKEEANPYAYERGSDRLTDWILEEGFTFEDEILFLVWW